MVHDLKPIGKRISQCRRNNDLTQKQLAAKINISNNHLSNIENGKTAPGFDTFIDICSALKADASYIIGGEIYSDINEEIISKLHRCSDENRIRISRILDVFVDEKLEK